MGSSIKDIVDSGSVYIIAEIGQNHQGNLEHAKELIDQCISRLNEGGQLIFSTNYRKFKAEKAFDLKKYKVKELTNQLCSKDFEGKWASRCWEIRSA